MKKLLLLCLLPVLAFAEEKTSCFRLEDMEEIKQCYIKLAGQNSDNNEEIERLSSESLERLRFWLYTEYKDEMRNQSTYVALVRSENELSVLDSVEDDVSLILRKGINDKEVLFSIDDGMFNCRYNGCSIAVKIDDSAIFNLAVEKGERSGSLFLINKKQRSEFVKKLKKGKRMIVELPIYGHGDQQAKFNIEGLKWEHF